MSNIIIPLKYNDDFYEIAVKDYRIVRILRYWGGSSQRQEVDFQALSYDLQDKIFDKIKEVWSGGD